MSSSTYPFRHSQCTLLIEDVVQIKKLQERLRHKDINTPLNTIMNLNNKLAHKKDASHKLSQLMEDVFLKHAICASNIYL
ncbi:integrase [Staphylococcus argenteus]|nr:integrase [Staphylococcus argenteus]